MSDAGELPAITESDSAGHVYRLRDGQAIGPVNPARDIYPVYSPWLTEAAGDAEALADRIKALDDGQRSWVLYRLAFDPDPDARALLSTALDDQARRQAEIVRSAGT